MKGLPPLSHHGPELALALPYSEGTQEAQGEKQRTVTRGGMFKSWRDARMSGGCTRHCGEANHTRYAEAVSDNLSAGGVG